MISLKKNSLNHKSGVSLVEVVIAASILAVFVAALGTTQSLFLKTSLSGVNKAKAIFLAEEGVEAIKLLRDQSWTKNIAAIPIDTNYYLSYNSGTNFWATTTVNTYVDGRFERKFMLGNVYRDANDDIASLGTYDSGSRLVTVTVAWSDRGATTTKVITTYVMNLSSN